MKLSVFFEHIQRAAEQRGFSLEESLRAVRDMGYTMVEMDYDILAEDPAILPALREAGLGISNICCFFRFDSDPQHKRMQALVKQAAESGARQIMPIPGFYAQAGQQAAELERMLSAMQELAALAQEAGLAVTIEDFDNIASPIRDCAGIRWFLDRVPGLGVTFDTGNFRFCGEDVLSAFDALSDRIVHVHLKDRAWDARYGASNLTAMDGTALHPCALGYGEIPFDRIFEQLRRIGYAETLTVEHFNCEDQLTALWESAEFVKKHWH